MYEILNQDNDLEFIEEFKGNDMCIVYGSAWIDDMHIVADFINTSAKKLKHIIAPHHIDNKTVTSFEKLIQNKKIAHFTEKDGLDLASCDVLIIKHYWLIN